MPASLDAGKGIKPFTLYFRTKYLGPNAAVRSRPMRRRSPESAK